MDLLDFINNLDLFLENKLNFTAFSGKIEELRQMISDKLEKKELPLNEVTLSLLNILQNINMALNDTLIDSEALNKAKEKLLEINALYEKENKEELDDFDEEQELLRCVTERISEESYLTGNYILIRDSGMNFLNGKIPEMEFKKSFEDMKAVIREVKEEYENAFMNIEKWTLEISVGDKLFREGLKEWQEGLNSLSDFISDRKRETIDKGIRLIYEGNKKLVINQKLEEYINEIVESSPVMTLMPAMKSEPVTFEPRNQMRPMFPDKQVKQETAHVERKEISPVTGTMSFEKTGLPQSPVGSAKPFERPGLLQSPIGSPRSFEKTDSPQTSMESQKSFEKAGLSQTSMGSPITFQKAALPQTPMESPTSFEKDNIPERQELPQEAVCEISHNEEIQHTSTPPVETVESKSGIRRPGGAARRITGTVRTETPSPVTEQKITEEHTEPKKEEKAVRKPGGMSRRVGKTD